MKIIKMREARGRDARESTAPGGADVSGEKTTHSQHSLWHSSCCWLCYSGIILKFLYLCMSHPSKSRSANLQLDWSDIWPVWGTGSYSAGDQPTVTRWVIVIGVMFYADHSPPFFQAFPI